MSIDLLQQAVEAAKSGDRPNAIRLTKAYIQETPRDARGWWALTKFTDDPDVQRECLKRVLKLKPDHTQAQQMLDELNATASSEFRLDDIASPQPSRSPSWMDDDPSPNFTFDDADNGGAGYFQPEINYFSDVESSPSASMFSDVRNEPTSIRAAQTQTKSGAGGEWLVGIGLFLLAIIALSGLAFYAYQYQYRGLFGLFGPDLTKTARTSDFTIHYGSDWNGHVEGGIFVAASNNISSFTSGDVDWNSLNNPLSGGTGLEGNILTYQDLQDETIVVIVAPFRGELQTQFQSQLGANSFEGYINEVSGLWSLIGDNQISEAGVEFKFDVDDSSIDIDSETGTFFHMKMFVKVEESSPFYPDIYESMAVNFGNIAGDIEINMGVYMAAVQHNGTEYMFMMIAYGDNAESHERTAKRMLSSMEFLN